jgi:hypothetical protein
MVTKSQRGVKGILLGLAICVPASLFWAQGDAPERLQTLVAEQNAVLIKPEQPLDDTGAPPVPEATSLRSAAATSTQAPRPDFQLIGTLIAPRLTPSAVIDTGKGEALFTIGAAIDDRWQLHKVFPGKIVIRSAESESIMPIRAQATTMTDPETETIEKAPLQPQASHAEKLVHYYAGRPPEAVAFPGGLITRGIEKVHEGTFSIDMAALLDQHLRTPLRRQFDYEMDDRGMRLVEIVPGGAVDRFGFVPGDIVAKIDDVPITRVEDLQYLLHPDSDRIKVEFIRASTAMTHTYLLQ